MNTLIEKYTQYLEAGLSPTFKNHQVRTFNTEDKNGKIVTHSPRCLEVNFSNASLKEVTTGIYLKNGFVHHARCKNDFDFFHGLNLKHTTFLFDETLKAVKVLKETKSYEETVTARETLNSVINSYEKKYRYSLKALVWPKIILKKFDEKILLVAPSEVKESFASDMAFKALSNAPAFKHFPKEMKEKHSLWIKEAVTDLLSSPRMIISRIDLKNLDKGDENARRFKTFFKLDSKYKLSMPVLQEQIFVYPVAFSPWLLNLSKLKSITVIDSVEVDESVTDALLETMFVLYAPSGQNPVFKTLQETKNNVIELIK